MSEIAKESLLRTSVRSLYDMQKLRIAMGNRIVASFRDKLGIAPSESEEGDDKAEALKALKVLRDEYARITDGVVKVTSRFKSDSTLLTNYSEILLIESYERQLGAENVHTKLLERELVNYPIWNEYLRHIRGVGPLMGGVILSEINPYRCNSISALWAYAGVDVVTWFVCKKKLHHTAPDRLYKRHPYGYRTKGPDITGVDDGWFTLMDEEGLHLGLYGLPEPGSEEAEGMGMGRTRRKIHHVPRTYKDAEGDICNTTGITFNPTLKTKMVGVLGPVFIKLGGEYREVYDEYKARISEDPRHADKTKGHIHSMANRYMIKRFLADLWIKWREMEGLPTVGTYYAEKLNKAA